MKTIDYTITPVDPAAHLFEVSLRVAEPDAQGQGFMLPVWIPGSYLVREFARNIVSVSAFAERADGGKRRVAIAKVEKNVWRAAPVNGPLILTYTVYAWDLSVRATYLDDTTGFFNGSSVFLAVLGREHLPCRVDIRPPAVPTPQPWRVATAMKTVRGTRPNGFGLYRAQDYDELIDHPVTLGVFETARFQAHGIPHDVVIAGRVTALDLRRLARDLKRICETQIAFFDPDGRRAPVDRYVFMTLAVGDGYGGLEHRASTALICNRSDLPCTGQTDMTDGYRGYLGLCSHEYFHTWNVKRIKPAAFASYDLNRENLTSLLWLFEGFTSYYEDLMLVRSGLVTHETYFGQIGKTLGSVLRGSGRLKQSLAESSFDAWVKYYRQDENAPNAIVSYYTKGALAALAFDLAIRAQTRNRKSLDDVMRLLWRRYGERFYEGERTGIAEEAVEPLFREATGVDLGSLFADAVHGTRDLPLDKLFAPLGIAVEGEVSADRPSLGARIKPGADCMLAAVHEGGAAHRAGLSAHDQLVALDGLRVTGANLDALLARHRPGDALVVHAFRREELRTSTLTLDPPDIVRYRVSVVDGSALARRWRDAWLNGPPGLSAAEDRACA